MKRCLWTMLALMCCQLPLAAQLPVMLGNKWAGCHAVHPARNYEFKILPDGGITLVPERRSREPVAIDKRICINYGLEEVSDDGTRAIKRTNRDTLSASQEPTAEIRKLEIRGEANGGASFELSVGQQRDVMSLAGRVLESGRAGQSMCFALRIVIPNIYRNVETDDRKLQREFEKTARRDLLAIERGDGSSQRLDCGDHAVIDGAALTGKGIRRIELRLSYYEGRTLWFEATGKSSISITPPKTPGPWYEGLILDWRPSAEAAEAGELRCGVE
ncbi:MAG TPA: hypothetical protein VFY13_04430 [Luteolibacter sp.]|nr:hypothetical protein [Luteolibacter sp.]